MGFCLVFMSSCFWLTGEQKLGDRIYRVDNEILFSNDETYEGSAGSMIPPSVMEVNYDKKFIIVKSRNGKHQIEFWLIDKSMKTEFIKEIPGDSLHWIYDKYSNVFGPLDSIEFVKLKQQKGVELDW